PATVGSEIDPPPVSRPARHPIVAGTGGDAAWGSSLRVHHVDVAEIVIFKFHGRGKTNLSAHGWPGWGARTIRRSTKRFAYVGQLDWIRAVRFAHPDLKSS